MKTFELGKLYLWRRCGQTSVVEYDRPCDLYPRFHLFLEKSMTSKHTIGFVTLYDLDVEPYDQPSNESSPKCNSNSGK